MIPKIFALTFIQLQLVCIGKSVTFEPSHQHYIDESITNLYATKLIYPINQGFANGHATYSSSILSTFSCEKTYILTLDFQYDLEGIEESDTKSCLIIETFSNMISTTQTTSRERLCSFLRRFKILIPENTELKGQFPCEQSEVYFTYFLGNLTSIQMVDTKVKVYFINFDNSILSTILCISIVISMIVVALTIIWITYIWKMTHYCTLMHKIIAMTILTRLTLTIFLDVILFILSKSKKYIFNNTLSESGSIAVKPRANCNLPILCFECTIYYIPGILLYGALFSVKWVDVNSLFFSKRGTQVKHNNLLFHTVYGKRRCLQ